MFLLRSVFQPVSSPMVQGFNLLRLLNLENNRIAEWNEILKLCQLRRYRLLFCSFFYWDNWRLMNPKLISPYLEPLTMLSAWSRFSWITTNWAVYFILACMNWTSYLEVLNHRETIFHSKICDASFLVDHQGSLTIDISL